MKSIAFKVGCILLTLLGILILLGGLESLYLAYWGFGDAPAGVQLSDLAKLNPALPAALRGRRATAASLAVTCGILLCWIALTAFRHRQRWAWYALLFSFGVGAVLSLLRISVLGSMAGAAAPGIALITMLVALAVSYPGFRK